MGETLSDEEQKKVDFLVREATERQYILDASLAQRFLLARKGNVEQAFALFQEYILRFGEQQLLHINPNDPVIKEELLSGKYCIPGVKANDGTSIVVFRAKFHTKCSNNEDLHKSLQAVFFCLSYVLSTVQSQRNGVSFIFDMTKLSIRNVDTSLMKTMLTLLKNAFPGRLAVAFLYNSPRWFRTISTLLRPFIKRKMMERVKFIKDLTKDINPEHLPDFLGGNHPYDTEKRMEYIISTFSILSKYNLSHQSLKKNPKVAQAISARTQVHESKRRSQLAEVSTTTSATTTSNISSTTTNSTSQESQLAPRKPLRKRNLQQHAALRSRQQQHTNPPPPGRHTTVSAQPSSMLRKTDPTGRSSSLSSQVPKPPPRNTDDGFLPYSIKAANFAEAAETLLNTGEAITHFSDLQLLSHPVAFSAAQDPKNRGKNRYRNILPYDFNRVKLLSPAANGTDYVNASYINGYNQKGKFIASQGPLEGTVDEFWQMVWENRCPVIAMVAQVIEDGRRKCFAYWMVDKSGPLTIKIEAEKQFDEILYRKINLTSTRTKETRFVHHFQFTSWPDHGIPNDPTDFLFLRSLVEEFKEHSELNGPVLVHCSAGVGRTGTYITIDTVLAQIEKEGSGNVFMAINKLRDQRPNMVQTPMQYLFCYQAIAHSLSPMK